MSHRPESACPAEITNTCAQRHWAIYWILIVCSVAAMGARIVAVGSDGDSPFFSANDRSRWATIRSLGDEGKYEIDNVINDKSNRISWDSIDKVRHVNSDKEFRFYSSKPPLYPTMLSWIYLGVKAVTGWTITDETNYVARTVLLVAHLLPWLIYLWLFGLVVDHIPVRDWTRYYVLGAACFATFLSTFAVSLNNHLPAAIAVMVALYCLTQIWREDMKLLDGQYVATKYDADWWVYALAGLASGFAFANELPALSFVGLAGLVCLFRSPAKTFAGFLPALALVVAAIGVANYSAHGDWKLPYMHRGDGEIIASVSGDFKAELDKGSLPAALREAISGHVAIQIPKVERGDWPQTPVGVFRWVIRDTVSTEQVAITNPSSLDVFEIRRWNNWYDFPGSYWRASNAENKSAIDRGQSSQLLYSFHMLFGHHGIFSLTPIWLFSFAGILPLMINRRLKLRWLGWMTLVLTVVVVGFFMARPEMDRNYGGVTSGLRWTFWLIPLWLISMMPVVDWLGRHQRGRVICFLFLGASVMSVLYSADNPWVNPWLFELWEITGLPF